MNIGKKAEAISRKHFNELIAFNNKEFNEEFMTRYILATTTTCPKCPAIKKALMEKLGDNMIVVDENSDGFGDLIAEYGLHEAPSLIDQIEKKVVDISEILK